MRIDMEAWIIISLIKAKRQLCATEIIFALSEKGVIVKDLANLTKGLKNMCARNLIEATTVPATLLGSRLGRPTYYTWRREGAEAASEWYRSQITTTTTNEITQRLDAILSR